MRAPHRGMTLIDVLVGAALFLIIVLALVTVLRTSALLSGVTKAKTGAHILLESQMEYLRSLSYDSIGTKTGTPAGVLDGVATSTANNILYTLTTSVVYVDDTHDGTGASDTNGITDDYKVVELSVSYDVHGVHTEELAATFMPPHTESSVGGGTLQIHVVNTQGAPVSSATVRVVNTTVSPSVDTSLFTNAKGNAVFSGMKPGTNYQVFVSEAGYTSAQTATRGTTNANPTYAHLSVVANRTTANTFVIASISQLTIQTRNTNLSAKGNVPLVFKGVRTLGTDTNGVPVYANTLSLTTNASGIATTTLPWDLYMITSSGYSITSSTQPLPYQLLPGANATLDLILTP